MRLAVISDIHGNRLAFEAVEADIALRGADAVVNLGDLVSGPLDPVGTIDLLMERTFPTISGNHDRYLLERPPAKLDPVDSFVAARLAPRHFDYLRSLPQTRDIEGEVFMCHGTPTSDLDPWLDSWRKGRGAVLPDEAAVSAQAEGLDFPVLLCGHTHVSRIVRLRDGRLIVNPGSVGLQFYYGAPDARYAMLERHGGRWSASLHMVRYDWDAAAKLAVEHGFPLWHDALATGWPGAEGLF
ncbi:MAG: metallophosphoesterase family protein [Devosia sp.]